MLTKHGGYNLIALGEVVVGIERNVPPNQKTEYRKYANMQEELNTKVVGVS